MGGNKRRRSLLFCSVLKKQNEPLAPRNRGKKKIAVIQVNTPPRFCQKKTANPQKKYFARRFFLQKVFFLFSMLISTTSCGYFS
jgi:hypothetical protein